MASITFNIMAQITTKLTPKILPKILNASSVHRLEFIPKRNFFRNLSNDTSSKPSVLTNQDEKTSTIQQDHQQQQQTQQQPGSLKLSESCLEYLKQICNDGSFLRVTVEGGGCSGFTYKFDLDKKINPDDIIFGDDKNGKVIIDSTSLEYCSGATVDYHKELIRCGFRITNNPKAEAGCSCGSSFALRLD